MKIKIGLQDLKLKKRIDYQNIEKHFKKEIDNLIEYKIDFI